MSTMKNWVTQVTPDGEAVASLADDYIGSVNKQRQWVEEQSSGSPAGNPDTSSPLIREIFEKERALDVRIARSLRDPIPVDEHSAASVAEQVVNYRKFPGEDPQAALDRLDAFYKAHNDAIEAADKRTPYVKKEKTGAEASGKTKFQSLIMFPNSSSRAL